MAPVPINNQDQALFSISISWSYVLSCCISWYFFLISVGLLRLNHAPRENEDFSVQRCVLYIVLFLLLPSYRLYVQGEFIPMEFYVTRANLHIEIESDP